MNEIGAMLITMVAFLLLFHLLQLTWSARKADESRKGLWIAEKHAVYVTLPLYAAGYLITLLVRWKENEEAVMMSLSGPKSLEDLKS